MGGLLWAIKFLTVVPVDRRNRFSENITGAAMVWFPGVGLLIGASLVAGYFLLTRCFPSPVADALILVAYIAITGGLHLDGLADSCDGVFGGGDRGKRLAIMRRSDIGAFGVIALICILGVRYLGLHTLTYEGQGLWSSQKGTALLLMPAIGRWAQVLAAALSDYARRSEEGVGKVFIDNVSLRHAFFSATFVLVPLWFLCGVKGLVFFAVVLLVALLVIEYTKDKIGGMTGDTLGAVNEICEVVFLLCLLLSLCG